LNEGDEARIRITKAKKKRPNSPSTSRTVRMELADSKFSRRRREEDGVESSARKCMAMMFEDTRVTVNDKTEHQKRTSQIALEYEERVQAFVAPNAAPDESQFTVVLYLRHRGKRYPIEVLPHILETDLGNAASTVMEVLCGVSKSTRYPV
jgi:hypothetical protein